MAIVSDVNAAADDKKKKKKKRSKSSAPSGGGGGGAGGTNRTSTATASGNNNNNSNKKAVEYNPRWDGYAVVALTSLIELTSASNVGATLDFSGSNGVALAFGTISFCFCFLVLALDRSQFLVDKFDYCRSCDGKFEGCALLFLVFYWIAGVAFITQVDGIGYLTLNVYFSTWLTLAGCIYTLSKWSGSKDILTLAEMTGLSATLRSHYVLLFSSLIVFGTSINYLSYGVSDQGSKTGSGAVLGCCIGFVSSLVALVWICVHYRFCTCFEHGGWIEFGSSVIMSILWIVATAIITQDGGVGK